MFLRKSIQILKRFILYLFLFIIFFILVTNVWVILSTQSQVYKKADDAPYRPVALVLGTSNKLVDGSPNPFFQNRMETTKELIDLRKSKHILVSGDNRSKYYNEPSAMRTALIQRGIRKESITLDFAGLRTFDSIVRCKEVFNQDSIIIVTQSFHAYRALFISNHYGMKAIAIVTDEPGTWKTIKVTVREFLARPLAVLDLYVLNTEPKFLGKKEKLNGL